MGAGRRRRPGQTVTCAWCKRTFPLLMTGRLPKYCGDTCRHKAWENRRALAEQKPVVEVMIQSVEVERRRPGPEVHVRRNGPGWVAALVALTEDLDRGRVYDRDLSQLAQQLNQVVRSLERRPSWSLRGHSRPRG
jgi:hypothetical protein